MRCGGSAVGQSVSGPLGGGIAIAPAGNQDARELDAGCRGAVGAIVRVVGRQSGVAQLLRQPEPAEDFHRTRRDVVAFHARRFPGGACFHDGNRYSPRCEVHCQSESDRTASDHENACLHHVACCQVAAMSLAGLGRSCITNCHRDHRGTLNVSVDPARHHPCPCCCFVAVQRLKQQTHILINRSRSS